jgi:hypothetical protein
MVSEQRTNVGARRGSRRSGAALRTYATATDRTFDPCWCAACVRQPGADPASQVRMPRRPCQHGAGYAEIVVLSGQAFVDNAALAKLGLKIHELLISQSAHRIIDNADQVGLHFGLKKFEKIGPANGIDQHRSTADGPPLRLHAVTVAADLKPDHARPKRVEQHLGIGCIIAQIGDKRALEL